MKASDRVWIKWHGSFREVKVVFIHDKFVKYRVSFTEGKLSRVAELLGYFFVVFDTLDAFEAKKL